MRVRVANPTTEGSSPRSSEIELTPSGQRGAELLPGADIQKYSKSYLTTHYNMNPSQTLLVGHKKLSTKRTAFPIHFSVDRALGCKCFGPSCNISASVKIRTHNLVSTSKITISVRPLILFQPTHVYTYTGCFGLSSTIWLASLCLGPRGPSVQGGIDDPS